MRMRPIFITAPAVAAAGVFGFPFLAAQESRQPRPPVPDTRAATGMFGPPPAQVTVTSQIKPPSNTTADNGMRPAGLFFPDAAPPPKVETVPVPTIPVPTLPTIAPVGVPTVAAPVIPTLPPNLPPPRVVDISNVPPAVEPKPLPIKTWPAVAPAVTPPAPAPVTTPAPIASNIPSIPSGPQPLVASAPPALMPTISNSVPMAVQNAMPFPNLPLLAKQMPNVMVEVQMPESISVGAALDYILVVKNTGTASVAHVKVEDELPTGAKFLASEPTAELAGDRLSWSLGTLDAGAEKRIKVSVKPGEEGELRSRAMVSFTAAAEARVKVTRPRVAVTLSGVESVRVGEEVPFTIRVTNTGSGPASNVMVKAKLSDGLHHPAGGQIEAVIDRLPAGETKTITLRALATKSGSNVCNLVTTGDGLVVEGTQSAVNVVESQLTAKINGPAKCMVKGEPEFRIELANPGSAPTDPVSVWCVLPDGFEYISCSDSGSYNAANRTVIWSLPPLNAASNRNVGVKFKAGSAVASTIKVIAQSAPPMGDGVVTASARSGVGRILEVKTDAPIKAEGVPALRFEVVDVEDPVEVGKEAIYDIKVTNTGTGACTNVSLIATLADGTSTAGATGPTTARGQGQQVTFDPLPTLNAKGEAVFRIKVRGNQPGDTKLRVQISCDEIRTPTIKEENTRFLSN
ncbi:N/A [soil metagenome]